MVTYNFILQNLKYLTKLKNCPVDSHWATKVLFPYKIIAKAIVPKLQTILMNPLYNERNKTVIYDGHNWWCGLYYTCLLVYLV